MNTKHVIVIILVMVGAVYATAQTVNDSLIKPKSMVGCNFFVVAPKSINSGMMKVYFKVQDNEGNSILAMALKDGVRFSSEDSLLIIPVDKVLNSADFLLSWKQQNELFENSMSAKGSILAVGNQMTEFSVKDTQGNVWTNKNTKGKPLVLNFWNTACGPCKKEMPELNQWITELPKANYLAITYNTAKQIERIVTSRPFLFHQITADKTLWNAFGIQQNPTTILIDKKGKISYIEIGTNEAKRADLKQRLQKLCDE